LALISFTTNGSYLSFLSGEKQSLIGEYALFSNDENETIAFPISAPEDLLNVLEDKRTIFYVFGYLEEPGIKNVQTMMKGIVTHATDKRSLHVDKPSSTKELLTILISSLFPALCYERTDNVVLLDWSKYSNGSYVTVYENALKVGRLFAQSVRVLVNGGLDVSKIYIVGHSLGVHLAAFAGKCNDFVIPRITGT